MLIEDLRNNIKVSILYEIIENLPNDVRKKYFENYIIDLHKEDVELAKLLETKSLHKLNGGLRDGAPKCYNPKSMKLLLNSEIRELILDISEDENIPVEKFDTITKAVYINIDNVLKFTLKTELLIAYHNGRLSCNPMCGFYIQKDEERYPAKEYIEQVLQEDYIVNKTTKAKLEIIYGILFGPDKPYSQVLMHIPYHTQILYKGDYLETFNVKKLNNTYEFFYFEKFDGSKHIINLFNGYFKNNGNTMGKEFNSIFRLLCEWDIPYFLSAVKYCIQNKIPLGSEEEKLDKDTLDKAIVDINTENMLKKGPILDINFDEYIEESRIGRGVRRILENMNRKK